MTQEHTAPRDLFGPGQTGAIRDLLQSIFVAEIIQPSQPLWLAFGWISDVEMIDNRAREFSSLNPDWPSTGIRLSLVIKSLVERGGKVFLVVRNVEHNRIFVEKLKALREKFPNSLKVAFGEDVHEKGILGRDFLLSGSMNLTFNGITINDEHLTLRTDRSEVEEWRLVLEQKWGAALK
jgi:hypothetical protein